MSQLHGEPAECAIASPPDLCPATCWFGCSLYIEKWRVGRDGSVELELAQLLAMMRATAFRARKGVITRRDGSLVKMYCFESAVRGSGSAVRELVIRQRDQLKLV